MSGKYVSISKDEMDQFLIPQGFSSIQIENTFELVYAKRVFQDDLKLSLRIYTGINSSGISRDVGEDAIRVYLFMKKQDNSIVKICGCKRVNRIETWKNNLQQRINSWNDSFPKHKCDLCKMPMILRKGSNGDFLGCSNFPNCKFTKKAS
jgi:hypothetical protein